MGVTVFNQPRPCWRFALPCGSRTQTQSSRQTNNRAYGDKKTPQKTHCFSGAALGRETFPTAGCVSPTSPATVTVEGESHLGNAALRVRTNPAARVAACHRAVSVCAFYSEATARSGTQSPRTPPPARGPALNPGCRLCGPSTDGHKEPPPTPGQNPSSLITVLFKTSATLAGMTQATAHAHSYTIAIFHGKRGTGLLGLEKSALENVQFVCWIVVDM